MYLIIIKNNLIISLATLVADWEPVVKAQLQEIKPDIVFYGNTWEASIINPIEPDISWQTGFNVNETKYEFTSDGGNKYRIFISKYRNTNKILVNGYHPGLGNSSQWQTEFIQEYMKNS